MPPLPRFDTVYTYAIEHIKSELCFYKISYTPKILYENLYYDRTAPEPRRMPIIVYVAHKIFMLISPF